MATDTAVSEPELGPWPSFEQITEAHSLWVSADYRAFAIEDAATAKQLAQDVLQRDEDGWRIYRRFDPRWYGWLYQQQVRDKTALLHAARGALSGEEIALRGARLTLLWLRAKTRHGREAVLEAQNAYLPSDAYSPPKLPPGLG